MRFSRTAFFVLMAIKEKKQEQPNSRAITEVNSSIRLASAWLEMCSDVMTTRQNPSRLADVFSICCEVLFGILKDRKKSSGTTVWISGALLLMQKIYRVQKPPGSKALLHFAKRCSQAVERCGIYFFAGANQHAVAERNCCTGL